MAEEKKTAKKTAVKKAEAKKVVAKEATTVKKAAVKKTTTVKKSQTKEDTISVTLVKSFYGRLPSHRATITGLGLKKINQTRELKNTPEVRGMISKVSYLLKVED